MVKRKSRVLNRVRDFRLANNEMTQQELASAIGVARQTIIAIEQGKFCPALESALRLAQVFEVSVDDIFTLSDSAGG
ncbi:MAG: helix-turn-helix transcriptional regulator [Pseudomonadota bacterium]